jgi:hypothetical protein
MHTLFNSFTWLLFLLAQRLPWIVLHWHHDLPDSRHFRTAMVEQRQIELIYNGLNIENIIETYDKSA